jgi:hypothetical protein
LDLLTSETRLEISTKVISNVLKNLIFEMVSLNETFPLPHGVLSGAG